MTPCLLRRPGEGFIVERGINYEELGSHLLGKGPMSSNLALAAQRGDRAAFLQLVQGFDVIVLRVALNLTGSENAAQQIYCSVFADAFLSVNKLNSGSTVFIWLYRILTRRCLQYCQRYPQAIEVDCIEDPLWCQLRTALHTLSPIERMIFHLKRSQELKIRTLAEIFNVTPEFVIDALRNINRKLREHSKDHGDPPLSPSARAST